MPDHYNEKRKKNIRRDESGIRTPSNPTGAQQTAGDFRTYGAGNQTAERNFTLPENISRGGMDTLMPRRPSEAPVQRPKRRGTVGEVGTIQRGTELYRVGPESTQGIAQSTNAIARQQANYLGKSSAELGADRAEATSQVMGREFNRARGRDYSEDLDIDFDKLTLSDSNKELLRVVQDKGNFMRDLERRKVDIAQQANAINAAGSPGVVQNELRTRSMGDLLDRGAEDYRTELSYGLPPQDSEDALKSILSEVMGTGGEKKSSAGVFDPSQQSPVPKQESGFTREFNPSIAEDFGYGAKNYFDYFKNYGPSAPLYQGTQALANVGEQGFNFLFPKKKKQRR
jgi:hypothetical protein